METTATAPPQPDPTSPTSADHERRLTRSRHDRMLAGVAGGLGEYLNVDPVLIRIGFVALAFFGGGGLVLYLLGWLLIPEEGCRSSVLGRRRGLSRGALVALIAVLLLAVVRPWQPRWHPLTWPLVLVGGGAVLLLLSRRQREASTPAAAAFSGSSPTVELSSTFGPPEPPAPPVPSVTPYLLAALAVLGALAALTGLSTTAALAIGLVLAAAALVVGAARGRMGATPVLVIVAGLALAASLVAPPGLGDGVGNRTFQPTSASAVPPSYRLGIGHLVVDLSALHGLGSTVKARLGIGTLLVVVPAGTSVSIHEHAGIGTASVLGDEQHGMVVDRTALSGGGGANPDFRLDAEVGIGRVELQRAAA